MHKNLFSEDIASAKLNLHLQVLNRRDDGYHNLFSIMAEIGIYDLLKLESFNVVRGKGEPVVEIFCSGGRYASALDGVPSGKNLISVAVRDYLKRSGLEGHVRFSIEKNIPSGAGLGGGSSDAASALNLTRRALKREPDMDLFASALSSGSDVPFFLSGGIAFAEARGEILRRIDQHPCYNVVLINNGIHVNTGTAYSSLGRGYEPAVSMSWIESRRAELESVMSDISLWRNYFENDFEGPVFKLYPELGFLKESLYDLGADFALMSGSGSTVYGIFRDEKNAEKAANSLESEGNRVVVTKIGRGKINY